MADADVDFDVHNAFGIPLAKLTINRFRAEDGQLPVHMQASQEFVSSVAVLCREAGKQFVDSEQCSLEIRETVRPQQISTRIVNEKEIRAQEDEIERREELRMQRLAALRKVLGKINVWRRPIQISRTPSFFGLGNDILKNLPVGKALTADGIAYLPKFREGIFDDGFFWTAAATVATRRAPFENIFVSAEHADIGMYTFQFYHYDVHDPAGSGWKCVSVDDQIPCSSDYLPVLGKLDEPSEMWAVMLEKAYAKFLGSYSLLHIGDTWESMVHLTGGKCEMHNWDVERVSVPSTCVVWWLLNENHRHGLLQSTLFLDKEPGDAGTEDVRLLHHTGDGNEELIDEEKFYVWNSTACTVLQTYEFKQQGPHQGTQLVLLRNVFGQLEWNGDWSATSSLWTKEIREQMNYKTSDDFLTWMKIDDFVRQYNTLLTCFNFKGAPTIYFDTLKPVAEGGLAFHAHQYLITVIDPKGSTTDLKGAQKKKPGKQARAVVLDHLKLEDQPDAEDRPEDEGKGVDMDAVERKEEKKAAAEFSFSAMKQKLTVDKAEEENTGPKFTVKLYLSQPKQDNMATVPRDISLELFKVKGRQLQNCTFVDTEYGYNEQGEVTTYQFVQNNKIRLTEDKAETRFEMNRSAVVQPGHYIVALHQHYFRDELRYCLSFSTEDDKDLPTGYTTKVEYIGTCATPKLDAANKKKAPVRTPRKNVEERIEKQRAYL